MPFRLHLFGTCRITGPDGLVEGRVSRPRQLAFLALASAPSGGTTRDRIGAYLWPDTSPSDARHLVADTLHILRKELGDEGLRSVGECICLDPSGIWCDVPEFRAARAAEEWERMLELYEGPFLDGFHGPGGGDFERWVEGERLRCREVALYAVHRLAALRESRGDLVGAADCLRRGRAVDPFDEQITRKLMAFLARLGNRAEAVRAYRTLDRRLSRELDLRPSPETRAVREAILAGEASGEPAGDPALRAR
ncbi:MAG: hypothetical protein GWM92_04740 [Gemmatimonadetes bacterium]|nr:hypothetical protein [Gemmatimonadota bacterium]NIR77881.1 hypothetical protein [Gemmatimonadota bacterium]NIT86426.1 hypothetical protein [Gemmatimonadota bacterium]NIU30263.1 hypothetical protein [Gemmatimonadota bacterium]NIU35167.1 hypothetical protein [Gemmatimonadota bacterium]